MQLRALHDVNFDTLEVVTSTKGAIIEPLYQIPEPIAVGTGTVPAGSTVYNGSCHCGAVRYALVSPTKVTAARGCNCSICWRVRAPFHIFVYAIDMTMKW